MMNIFEVDEESSAISFVGWDPNVSAAIFVYKNNGTAADIAYWYDDVDKEDMMKALIGQKSLGIFANSLKDPNTPAKQATAQFGQKLHFYFGQEDMGEVIPLKALRDANLNGSQTPWEDVTNLPKEPVQSFSDFSNIADIGKRTYAW